MSALRRLVHAPLRVALALWRWADLDADDLHYYPGVAIVAAGLWLVWPPLAFVGLGLGLIYPAVWMRRNG